jgi:hypothetical protein
MGLKSAALPAELGVAGIAPPNLTGDAFDVHLSMSLLYRLAVTPVGSRPASPRQGRPNLARFLPAPNLTGPGDHKLVDHRHQDSGAAIPPDRRPVDNDG